MALSMIQKRYRIEIGLKAQSTEEKYEQRQTQEKDRYGGSVVCQDKYKPMPPASSKPTVVYHL